MSTSPAKNVIVSTKNDPAPNENADDISTVYQNFVTLYHEIRNMEKFTVRKRKKIEERIFCEHYHQTYPKRKKTVYFAVNVRYVA